MRQYLQDLPGETPGKEVWAAIEKTIPVKSIFTLASFFKWVAAACLVASLCYAAYRVFYATNRKQTKPQVTTPHPQLDHTDSANIFSPPDSTVNFPGKKVSIDSPARNSLTRKNSFFISNRSYTLIVNTWTQDSFKLVCKGVYSGNIYTHEQLGIDITITDRISIITNKTNISVADSVVLTLYMPEHAALELENNYSSVFILQPLKRCKIRFIGARLEAPSIENFDVWASGSEIKSEKIDVCHATLIRSVFKAGRINKLEINSNYSTLEFQSAGLINGKSVSDSIHLIKGANLNLKGSNTTLVADTLENSLEYSGSRNFISVAVCMPRLKSIDISNNAGTVVLMTSELPDYSLKISGAYKNLSLTDKLKPYTPPGAVKPRNSPVQYFRVGSAGKGHPRLSIDGPSAIIEIK